MVLKYARPYLADRTVFKEPKPEPEPAIFCIHLVRFEPNRLNPTSNLPRQVDRLMRIDFDPH